MMESRIARKGLVLIVASGSFFQAGCQVPQIQVSIGGQSLSLGSSGLQMGGLPTLPPMASLGGLTNPVQSSFIPGAPQTTDSGQSPLVGQTPVANPANPGTPVSVSTDASGVIPDSQRAPLMQQALQLAGVPVTNENVDAVNTIVTNESGWKPGVTNDWDSNARNGDPSRGLMQTIGSTFRANALPGYDQNIVDPL